MMDVYVISNVWAREGSAIVGVAASADLAEEIANRVGAYRWSAWEEHGGTRERTAMLADGTAWPKLRQEIVRVPLAGPLVLDGDEPLRFSSPAEIGRKVIESFTTQLG